MLKKCTPQSTRAAAGSLREEEEGTERGSPLPSEQVQVRPTTYQGRMTETDKLTAHIDKEPVHWHEFSTRIADIGELDVAVVEMRCLEDFALHPRPHNAMIVAVVLVAWTGRWFQL